MELANGKDVVCLTLLGGARTGLSVEEGEVIGLVRGQGGYITTTYGTQTREWVEEINRERFNVEPYEESAYSFITMFGRWDDEENIKAKFKKDAS